MLIVFCFSVVPNCQTSGMGETCISCVEGYRLHNSTLCLKEIVNCVSYNQNNCTLCQIGMQLINNTCVPILISSGSNSQSSQLTNTPALGQTSAGQTPTQSSLINSNQVNYVTIPAPSTL